MNNTVDFQNTLDRANSLLEDIRSFSSADTVLAAVRELFESGILVNNPAGDITAKSLDNMYDVTFADRSVPGDVRWTSLGELFDRDDTGLFAGERQELVDMFADTVASRIEAYSASQGRNAVKAPGEVAPMERMMFGSYDMMTLGTSSRSVSELMDLFPQREDGDHGRVVVAFCGSIASNTGGKSYFNYNKFSDYLQEQGYGTLALPALSDEPGTSDYNQSVNTLMQYMVDGYNVVLLTPANNPLKTDALYVGQTVEQNSNIRVAHISTDRGKHAVVNSQEQLVRARLGGRFPSSGDSRDVYFNRKGGYELKEGVDLENNRARKFELINGNWSYGNPIEYRRTDMTRNELHRDVTAKSDIVLMLTTPGDDRNVILEKDIVKQSNVLSGTVDLFRNPDGSSSPLEASKLRDPEYVTFVAKSLADQVKGAVESNGFVLSGKDMSHLTVSFFGADIAHLSRRPEGFEAVSQAELDAVPGMKMKEHGFQAGMADPGDLGDIQPDLNDFAFKVFTRMQELIKPARVTSVVESLNSGVALAFTKAAQRAGIKDGNNLALTTQDCEWVSYDGTKLGNSNRHISVDERNALVHNEFHSGEPHEMSEEELNAQAELLREQSAIESGKYVGLTENQVIMLKMLNLSDDTISKVYDLSVQLGTTIPSNEAKGIYADTDAMMDFLIDGCIANGIDEVSRISDVMIGEANQRTAELIRQAQFEGTVLVTLASPLYSESLRNNMPGYESTINEVTIIRNTDEDGQEVTSVSVSADPVKVRENKPAVLAVRGNALLPNGTATVSVFGNTEPTGLEIAAAREMGRSVSAAGLTLVASLDDELGKAALEAASMNDGKCYAVTSRNISDLDDNPEEKVLKDNILGKGGAVASTEPVKGKPREEDKDKRKKTTNLRAGLSSSTAVALGELGSNPWEAVTAALLSPAVLTICAGKDIRERMSAIKARPNENEIRTLQKKILAAKEDRNNMLGKGEIEAADRNIEKMEQELLRLKNPKGVIEVDPLEHKGVEDVINEAKENHARLNPVEQNLDEAQKKLKERTLAPREYGIPVVACGGRKYAFIPENMPDVRKAMAKYDASVTILDPEQRNALEHRLRSDVEIVNGREVEMFSGYGSVAALEYASPDYSTLYFINGQVYTYANAPDHTRTFSQGGEILTGERRRLALGRFQHASEEVNRMLDTVMDQIGYHGQERVVLPGALTARVHSNSIELINGDVVVGEICITDRGLYVSNRNLMGDELNDTLGNYQVKGDYRIFEKEGRIETADQLESALKNVSDRMLGTYPTNLTYVEDASMDELLPDDQAQKIRDAYAKADNLRNAAESFARSGIVDPSTMKSTSILEAYALLYNEIDVIEKNIGSLTDERQEVKQQLEEARRYRDAYSQTHDFDKAQLQADEASIARLEARLESLDKELDRLVRNDITMMRAKDSLAKGGEALVSSVKAGQENSEVLTLSVDGVQMAITNSVVTEEMKLKADERMEARRTEMAKEQGGRKYDFQDPKFEKMVDRGRIESRQAEQERQEREKKMLRSMDRVVDQDVDLKVRRVIRDGKMAYAVDNVVVSNFYGEPLPPINGTNALNFVAKEGGDGKAVYLFDDNGKEIFDGAVEIGAPGTDNVALVKNEAGKYNYLNCTTGEAVLDTWASKAFSFDQGWGWFQDEATGKINAVKADGTLISQKGFDKGPGHFDKEGLAHVEREGKEYTVNTAGKIMAELSETITKGGGKGRK